MRLYPSDMLQVVGHTPVEFVVKEENLLTLDNFSTYRNGEPIGDERYVCVDTITMEYEMMYAKGAVFILLLSGCSKSNKINDTWFT